MTIERIRQYLDSNCVGSRIEGGRILAECLNAKGGVSLVDVTEWSVGKLCAWLGC